MSKTGRPNILLLMGDEHPVFMTGCYGHRSVKTPTLDGLAAQGTMFDAAYCPSPICAPLRYWNLYRDKDVDLPVILAHYRELEHEHVRGLWFKNAAYEWSSRAPLSAGHPPKIDNVNT